MLKDPALSIPRLARYTWSRQWPAVILMGLSFGVMSLSPFVVKRSLGAPEWIVPFLIALWQVAWILTPLVEPLLARSDPQRLWRWIAAAAFLPVLAVAFVSVVPLGGAGLGTGNLTLFVVIMFLHHAVLIALVPHRGALIRNNYAPEVRGRFYGRLQCLAFLAAMAAARVAAPLLDDDPRRLRLLFPIAAILGGVGVALLGRIRWRHQKRKREVTGLPRWRDAWRVLKEDRAYRTYQIAFMLYGFGFLMSWPLPLLLAEKKFGASTSEWTWAQMFAFPAAQIVTIPLWGRLSDGVGVIRTTALAFGVLALFLVAMAFVRDLDDLVMAFALFGVAMAGVDVGWSLGPLHFAREGRAHMYTAVHFSLVGIRSVIAPFLGFLLMKVYSFRTGYLVAVAFMVAAIWTIRRLQRLSSAA